MPKRVNFHFTYHAQRQREFNERLVEGDFVGAYDAIKGLPQSGDPVEHLERNVVLLQAYSALCEKSLGDSDNNRFSREVEKLNGVLEALGSIE